MKHRQLSRRTLLRASARAGVGAAGLALVGCGDDDGQQAAAQTQQQAEQQQQAAEQQAMQQQQAQAAQATGGPRPGGTVRASFHTDPATSGIGGTRTR